MKAVLCVPVLVVLCICAMAFADLEECLRTAEEVTTAQKSPVLRKEIKQHLNLTLEDGDSISTFTVYDQDLDHVANFFFVYREEVRGKTKTGKAYTFKYASEDGGYNYQATPILYRVYKEYLEKCKVLPDDENTEG